MATVVPPTTGIRAVRGLVEHLDRLDVTVPSTARRALSQSDVLAAVTFDQPQNLLDLAPDELREHVVRLTLANRFGEVLKETAADLDHLLAVTAAEAIAADLDGVLDQLRPGFDAAAKLVRQARQAGIGSATTSQQAITLGDQAVAAWRALPAATSHLADVATLRLAVSDVCGAPPRPEPTLDQPFSNEPAWTACFTRAIAPWRPPQEPWQSLWLRLSADAPLSLLSTSDTARVLAEWRRRRHPEPPADDDAPADTGKRRAVARAR